MERLDQIRILYHARAGLTARGIKEATGLPEWSIRENCKAWGIALTPGKRGKPPRDPAGEDAIDLADADADIEFGE